MSIVVSIRRRLQNLSVSSRFLIEKREYRERTGKMTEITDKFLAKFLERLSY